MKEENKKYPAEFKKQMMNLMKIFLKSITKANTYTELKRFVKH